MKKQIKTIEIAGKTFKLNKVLIPTVPYLVGVNVCDRIGNDSVIVILHPKTLCTVASYTSKIIGIDGLRKVLSELTCCIPHAVLCIVRNSTGLTLIDSILNDSTSMAKYKLFYEDNGTTKRYGISVNEAYRALGLNAVLNVSEPYRDKMSAVAAATSVNIKNTNTCRTKVEMTRESNDEWYSTTNQSFIDVALYLKDKGIKNYDFMLALKNKDLIGVDPHSPNLSGDQMQAIIQECRANHWYFFREVLRVPEMGGGCRPFELNRGTAAMIWLFSNDVDVLAYLPANCGKTVAATAILTYINIFDTNIEFTVGSRTSYDSMLMLERFGDYFNLLPKYIRFIKKAMPQNTINTYKWDSRKKSNDAVKTYIGFFDNIDYMAEFEKLFDPKVTKVSNPLHSRIFTSTPGDLNYKSVQFANQIFNGAALFDILMYDMKPVDLTAYVHRMSMNGLVAVNMNYLELGKDQKWFEEHCKCLGNNEDAIRRRLLLERYSGKVTDRIKKDLDGDSHSDKAIKTEPSILEMLAFKLNNRALYEGITFEKLIDKIIDVAIERTEE